MSTDTAASGSRLDVTSVLLLTAGMTLFGSATPISKIVGAAFPAILGSALRMVTAAVVLVPLYVARRRRDGEPVRPDLTVRDRWLLAGISAIGTFGFTVLLLLGLRMVPGAVAAVVMALAPMVTAIGAVLFLGEHLDRWTLLALVIAIAGATVVNLGSSSGGDGSGGMLWLGTLVVIGAIACEACYSLMGKRLTADLSPLAIATFASLLAGAMFAPIAAYQASGFDWGGPSWTDWAAVVFWGAGTMGLGSVLWFRGMHRVEGTTASTFMAVMPVSALVLSYVLLGEDPRWIHGIGMAAVVTAIVIAARKG